MPEGTIDLTIVAPERAIVHEQVDELEIPGAEGYLGVLPGHAALFSELKVGELGYRKGDRWFFLSVAWGFVEVLPNQVRILAETAERAQEIDLERAERAKRRGEKRIVNSSENSDYNAALVALVRALSGLHVSR